MWCSCRLSSRRLRLAQQLEDALICSQVLKSDKPGTVGSYNRLRSDLLARAGGPSIERKQDENENQKKQPAANGTTGQAASPFLGRLCGHTQSPCRVYDSNMPLFVHRAKCRSRFHEAICSDHRGFSYTGNVPEWQNGEVEKERTWPLSSMWNRPNGSSTLTTTSESMA